MGGIVILVVLICFYWGATLIDRWYKRHGFDDFDDEDFGGFAL